MGMIEVTDIVNTVTTVLVVVTIGLKIFVLLSQKSHNIKLKNLSERASIIVTALEQSGMTSEEKKDIAVAKLSVYAKQVGIKASPQQLEDYIESSVHLAKNLSGQ